MTMPDNANAGKQGVRINKGLLTAIPCLIFSVLCMVASRTYPKLTASYMLVSASFFPTIVSGIAIAMSLIMLVKAILKPEFRDPLTAQEKKGLFRGLLTIADCFVYILLFKPLGYILTSTLCYFALMLIFGNRKWLQMVIMAIVLPLLLFFAFTRLLGTNLPLGVLQYIF